MEPRFPQRRPGWQKTSEGAYRRSERPDRYEEAPLRKKGASRQTSRERLLRELLPAAIAVGVGFAFLLPILVEPEMFLLTWLVAFGISIFGFVKGCMRASRAGSFVAFDYLESLGPLRWFFAVGFFGFYLCGYLALWAYAQIRCTFEKPKAFLPWLGVQAFGPFLVLIAILVAAVSKQVWQKVRPSPPFGQPAAFGPGAGGQGKKQEPEREPEPPVVTGDREIDRLLARVCGKDSAAQRTAAEQLAGMKPNQHRPVVARILADAVQKPEVGDRPVLIRALGVWTTAKEAPVIIRFVSEGDANTRNEALKVAGKLRDERAVEPAIRCLESIHTTYHAEEALKKMGDVAEDGLLAALERPADKGIWIPIIRILKEIGTKKSIPALEAASKGDFSIKGSAQAALDAVRKRTGK